MCRKNMDVDGYHYNEAIIKNILYQYNKCKKMPAIYDNSESTHKYVQTIEGALEMLNNDARLIIINDFIDKRKESNWWNERYSRSTYYRYKGKAMQEFIRVLK